MNDRSSSNYVNVNPPPTHPRPAPPPNPPPKDHASALIIAGVGTVVLRHDGSVAITDRNRVHYEIDPDVVRAICALANKPPKPLIQEHV